MKKNARKGSLAGKLQTLGERILYTLVFGAVLSVFWFALQYVEQQASPIEFAKMHLQVGKPRVAAGTGAIKKTMFSPDHDIKTALVGLIDGEVSSICMAMYMFTEKEIAGALARAHARGVRVEVVADPSSSDSRFGRVPHLAKTGIPCYVFKPYDKDLKGFDKPLMHHKFFLFADTIGHKYVVCTGSFNCTRSACCANQENLVFLEDEDLYKDFAQQFEVLKKRARRY